MYVKCLKVVCFLVLVFCKQARTVVPPKNILSAEPLAPVATPTAAPAKAILTFSKTSYDAGMIFIGTSVDVTLTITNSGDANATTLSSATVGAFQFKGGTYPGTGGTCSTSLAVKSSCTIILTFESSDAVNQSVNFSLSYSNGLETKQTTTVLTGIAAKYSLKQKVVASGTNGRVASDYFGLSTAFYEDTLVMGAALQDYDENGANMLAGAGAAYVYTRTGSTWTLQQKLVGVGTNGRNASDAFGIQVALYKDIIAVAANLQAYDQNGANSVSNCGAVFIFKRTNSVWTLHQKIVGTGTNSRSASDNFGNWLALDETTLAIAAPYQDYDENGANSVTDAGAVFIFTQSGDVWSLQQKVVATGTNARVANDYFGSRVVISKDTMAISAYAQDYDENGATLLADAGAVFIFSRENSVWTQQKKIVPTGTNARNAGDLFGVHMSISENTLVISARAHDYDENGANLLANAGAVFIYIYENGMWTFQQKLVTPKVREASDVFGWDSAITGNALAVSSIAYKYDENGTNLLASAGATFLYSRKAGVWTHRQTLTASVRAAGDNFGIPAQFSRDELILGAPYQDFDENGSNQVNDAGAIYTYQLSK